MALNIVLGILVVIGTLGGTGLGYVLSIRGKREEWKKEYREKRILPLVDHVNRNMQALFELRFALEEEIRVEKQLEESQRKESELEVQCEGTNDKEKLEKLVAAKTEVIQRLEESVDAKKRVLDHSKQISESLQSDVWVGLAAAAALDEELANLMLQWVQSSSWAVEDFSLEDLGNMAELGKRILARVDEVVVYGGKALKEQE